MSEVLRVDLGSPGALSVGAGEARLVQGPRGEPGAVFTPSVTAGVLSWSNDGGLPNPAPADITGPKGDKGDTGAQGQQGPAGPAGTVFVPAVDQAGNISWTNSGGLTNPETMNIRGPQGAPGSDGADGEAGPQGPAGADGGYYVPGVDSEGNLSWTASKPGMASASGANIKGPQGERGPQGQQGPAGPKGETGSGLDILGQFATLEELSAAVPSPEAGDNYYVGEAAPYNIYTWGTVDGVPQWIDGGKLQGAPGSPGGYYVPSVDGAGNLSWAASDADMPQAQGANIAGPKGESGPAGPVFTPSVDGEGNLSWSNNGGLANPATVNVRGPAGAAGSPGAAGQPGADGADGGYYIPSVNSETGALSWTASAAGMPAAAGANIKGPKGDTGETGAAGADGAPGADGGYYSPSVDSAGNLSWSASRAGMPQAAGANIRGPAGADALINGVNALTLAAGENVEVEQSGSTVTISAAGANALVVTVTGSDLNVTADKTNAEIWAAFQAGTPIYCVWDGYVLVLTLILEAEAYFGFAMNTDNGLIIIMEDEHGSSVYAELGEIMAEKVKFRPEGTGLTATNMQDAFVELLQVLGFTT